MRFGTGCPSGSLLTMLVTSHAASAKTATQAAVTRATIQCLRRLRSCRGSISSGSRSTERCRPGGSISVADVWVSIAVRSSSDMIIGALGRCPESTRTRSARISAADW